jgi:predicted PilT family ATPase
LEKLGVNQPAAAEGFQLSEATLTEEPEYIVRSDISTLSYANYTIIKGIPTENIGRVIGRQGSNIKKLESEYGVKLAFVKGTLHITEGDRKRRRALCKFLITSLPIVIECPLLPLGNRKKISNQLLKQMSFKHNVRIHRPSDQEQNGMIWGTIDNCRTVYKLIENVCTKPGGTYKV